MIASTYLAIFIIPKYASPSPNIPPTGFSGLVYDEARKSRTVVLSPNNPLRRTKFGHQRRLKLIDRQLVLSNGEANFYAKEQKPKTKKIHADQLVHYLSHMRDRHNVLNHFLDCEVLYLYNVLR